MKIVIYRKDNGVGLTRDGNILNRFLKDKYDVVLSGPENYVKADLAIHLEIPCWKSLKTNTPNVLIPNQDWWLWPPTHLKRFTEIACKTRGATNLFKKINDNTSFLGFTAEKRFLNITREPTFIHVAGKSALKGTQAVIHAWLPDYPTLTIVESVGRFSTDKKNIKYINSYIPDELLIKLQNKNLFHIQPSEIEGYGHVIVESLSCGAITITTNALPMSEFHAFCYCGYLGKSTYNMGVRFYVDPLEIRKCVEKALSLSTEEVIEQAMQAKQFFSDSREMFKINLKRLVEKYE